MSYNVSTYKIIAFKTMNTSVSNPLLLPVSVTAPFLLTKEGRICNRKKKVSSNEMLGKLVSYMQNDATGPLSYMIHKNKVYVDKGPICEI